MSKTDTHPREAPAPEMMQCMEVRGGNTRTNELFEMVGLRAWVYSRPHGDSAGGGDVHYISSCASGRITRVLLADVSGHGEEVSRVAVGLRDLMRQNINFVKQTRLVGEMNRQFAATGEHDGFATALVWTYFEPTRSLQISNAGHPSPLLYRQRQARWSALEQKPGESQGIADVPLGLFGQADYSEIETRLETGDLLLCFSDALVESLDESGEHLGSEGVLRIAATLDPLQPAQIIPRLTESIDSLNRGNLHRDDVTLLLVQATGSGIPLKNNMLALFRLAGGVHDHTRILS